MRRIFRDVYFYFVIVISITFIIIKIPHLSLPFYWDEAWSYSPAINYMLKHGLGILPDAIPPNYSMGHPLIFHFFEVLWMKIFGTGLVAAKSFPLLISVLLLFTIYFFCKKFLNRFTGVVACVIFASQEIFIAQSSFVLPEVLLTLLTITSFYFFFSKKKILYVISASMLVLTKESGIVLVVSLIFWYLLEYVFIKEKKTTTAIIKELTALFLPLFLVSFFFIIQKFTYGWYFYPAHINYITFNLNTFCNNMFPGYSAYLFAYYGRNVMTLFFLISIVFVFIKHYKITLIQKNVIYSFSIFIVLYLIFSSLNFYGIRYILCVFPLYIILSSFIIIKAFNKYKLLLTLLLIAILSVKIYYSFSKRNSSDHNIGFVDAVQVHKNIVSFCEQNKWQDKNIYTQFLLQQDLLNPDCGYLSDKNNVFLHVSNHDNDIKNADYCIFSSVEYNPAYDKLIKQYNLKLLKRFVKNNCWAEVYEIER